MLRPGISYTDREHEEDECRMQLEVEEKPCRELPPTPDRTGSRTSPTDTALHLHHDIMRIPLALLALTRYGWSDILEPRV